MEVVTLGSQEYQVQRAKLRQWLKLESILDKLNKATEPDADLISEYVSVALSISIEEVDKQTWMDVALAYVTIARVNILQAYLPFMLSTEKPIDDIDYPDSEWWKMCHLFAKKFGWCIEYIEQLDVIDAFSLLQEDLIDQQIEKEWEWSLSENSIGYDKNTKQSKRIELPRPNWMKPVKNVPVPKKIKIPRSFLPVGNVVSARTDAVN